MSSSNKKKRWTGCQQSKRKAVAPTPNYRDLDKKRTVPFKRAMNGSR